MDANFFMRSFQRFFTVDASRVSLSDKSCSTSQTAEQRRPRQVEWKLRTAGRSLSPTVSYFLIHPISSPYIRPLTARSGITSMDRIFVALLCLRPSIVLNCTVNRLSDGWTSSCAATTDRILKPCVANVYFGHVSVIYSVTDRKFLSFSLLLVCNCSGIKGDNDVSCHSLCRRRHVVGQRIVSASVVHIACCWSSGNMCSEYNNTNLLLRLLTAVLGTSIFILLHIPNIPWPTTWRHLPQYPI